MARYYEPTKKQAKGFAKWIRKRCKAVRAVAQRFDPWTLYRLGRDRVHIVAYTEDGTVVVRVSGKFNAVLFERDVFGVDPDKLIECDLPDDDEATGALINNPTEADFARLREMMGIRHKHEVN